MSTALPSHHRLARTVCRTLGWTALGAVLFVLVGWPLAMVFHAAFAGRGEEPGLSLAPRQVSLALQTSLLVVLTLVIAMPVGVALALALFRTDLPGRSVWRLLVLLPALVPIELHATAWLAALGPQGVARAFGLPVELKGMFGAAWVHALASIPWVVALVGAAVTTVEAELEEDCLLVAGPLGTMWHVTLRRSAGAVAAAAMFVAVLTAGEMAVTDLLQVRTYAETVYTEFVLAGRVGAATATAVPGLAVWLVLIAVAGCLIVRHVPQDAQALFVRRPMFRLGRGRWAALVGVLVIVSATLGVPTASLVWRTGLEYPRPAAVKVTESSESGAATRAKAVGAATGPRWTAVALRENLVRSERSARAALVLSRDVAAATAGITVAAAWLLAAFARRSRVGQWLVASLACVLFALPGPVLGIGLSLALRRATRWWLGDPSLFGLFADGCKQAAASPIVLAWLHSLRALPYALAVLWPVERLVNRALLEAAAIDGAGPLRRFWHVELPSCRVAIVAAAFVSAVLSIGELAGSVIVYPPGYHPLSVRIFALAHSGLENQLAGICLIMLAGAAVGALAVYVGLRWTLSSLKE